VFTSFVVARPRRARKLPVAGCVMPQMCCQWQDSKAQDGMAYSKASMKAVDKYVKNNYDSVLVRVPSLSGYPALRLLCLREIPTIVFVVDFVQ